MENEDAGGRMTAQSASPAGSEREPIGWNERFLRTVTQRRLLSLSAFWRYGLSVATAAAATVVRIWLIPWTGLIAVYSLALVSASVATVLFGFGPGILCAALGAAAVEAFVVPPSAAGPDGPAVFRLAIASATGFFVCWIIHRLRVAVLESRTSEERYRTLFEQSRDAVLLADPETGTILDANTQAQRLLGRSREELIGMHQTMIHPPGEEENYRAMFRQHVLKGGAEPIEFEMLDSTGRRIPVEAVTAVIDVAGKRVLQGIFRDIRERKDAEARRFDSHQRMAALLDALPVGVSFSHDTTCRHITGNRAIMEQFCVTPADNLSASAPQESSAGRQVKYFRDGRQLADSELPLQLAAAENREVPPMELEIVLPNGRRWFASASGAPIRDRAGRAVSVVAVTVDITDRKKAEEALRRMNEELEARVRDRTSALAVSEARYRALIENTLDIPYNVSTTGTVMYIGPQARHYGMEPADIVGRSFLDFVIPADRAHAAQDLQRTVSTGTANPMEFRVRGGDGRVYWFEERGALLRNAAGEIEGITGVLRDVTARKRTERIRARQQKRLQHLAARLASAQDEEQRRIAEGLHDDIAQLLAACSLKLNLAGNAGSAEEKQSIQAEVEGILREAARKVRSLSFELSSSSLHRLGLRETISELCAGMSGRYDIKLTLAGDGGDQGVDKTTATILFKAVRELLFNVVKHSGVKEATVSMTNDGRALKLSVTDQGTGFAQPPGGTVLDIGKGLGMAAIRDRLSDIGGTMRIESTPGVGTVVTLAVPLGGR
jgi:PAS domain S-box-containing protein